MGKTKQLLLDMSEEELLDLQVLYEVIGAECDYR